ncbi:hypothetical protein AHF37_00507 [Paragonimus kellicotti]|nr:hypothetical protein AHF37_00507 [Paragonimus kellicotti]
MDPPKVPAGLTGVQRARSVVVSRGCVANGFMEMCAKPTNRIASPHISRLRTQCCRDAWCNTGEFASPIPIFLGTTLVVVFLVLFGLVIMCWYQRQRVFLLKLRAQHTPPGPTISNYAALMPSRISSAPVTTTLSDHARSRCCPCCNLFQRRVSKHLYDSCTREDSPNHVTGQPSKLRNPIRVLNGLPSDPMSTAHHNTSKWVQTQQLFRHKEPIHHPHQSSEATQTPNDLAVGNIMWQTASDSGTDPVRFSRPSLTTNYSDELGQTSMYTDGNVGFDPHTRAYNYRNGLQSELIDQ